MRIAREYRLQDHAQINSLHAHNIPDGYIDREAIVGTPDIAVSRLQEIYDVGIDRIWLAGGSFDSDPEVIDESVTLLSTEVLPKLKRKQSATN